LTCAEFRGSLVYVMLVKICGLMRQEDAEYAREAGADLLGFIFVPGSRRWVSPDQCSWIHQLSGVEKVGVFRDAPLSYVLETVRALELDRIQLHGNESDEMLDQLDRPIIRRVGARGGIPDPKRLDFLLARDVLPLVDPGAGDGIVADWRQIGETLGGRSFALAGGLSPQNVVEAIAVAHPRMVDVSSGVESSLGCKDPDRMRDFVRAARFSSS